MARMTVKAGDDLINKLSKLSGNTTSIAKQVVRAGANPVADEIKKNLEKNLNDPAYVGKGDGGLFGTKTTKPTGDLLNSFGVSPADVNRNGVVNVHIGFSGYDRKGVPNALKARAMESGTSWLRKRPFVRPAVEKTRQKCLDEMEKAMDDAMKIYAL